MRSGYPKTPTTDGSPPPDASVCVDQAQRTPRRSEAAVKFVLSVPEGSYVVTQGQNCGAFDIEGVREELHFLETASCEWPIPAEGTTSAEGDGATMVWSGETIVTYQTCVECEPGWLDGKIHGVPWAVPADSYSATFAIFDSIPENCEEAAPGTLRCEPASLEEAFRVPPSEVPFSQPLYELCAADRTISVEFELPEMGERLVEVEVPLP